MAGSAFGSPQPTRDPQRPRAGLPRAGEMRCPVCRGFAIHGEWQPHTPSGWGGLSPPRLSAPRPPGRLAQGLWRCGDSGTPPHVTPLPVASPGWNP